MAHSEATKEKIRRAMIGKKHALGYRHTPEARERIRLGNLGKPKQRTPKGMERLREVGHARRGIPTGKRVLRQRLNGYVLVYHPNHPAARERGAYKGSVLEHRLIWEQTNGRYLLPTEDVHHINGIKDDNRAENLIAVTKSEHALLHKPHKHRH